MGEQIIQQPSEPSDVQRFAIWSSVTNDFTHLSLTQDEVIRHFASKAYEAARAEAVKIIEALRRGKKPYAQFTVTWGEANKAAYEAHPDEYEFEIRPGD